MRIVFMGSPQFAVPSLEALHSSDHNIIAAVTQPDRPSGRKLHTQAPPIKIAAERLNIPVLQPATTKSASFYEEIHALQPELLVVVAYGEILRANLLALPPRGAINLHASLLPRYRGAAPIAWAILRGETESGATTMFMNEAMDAGPILLQEECEIAPEDTAESLGKKISERGAILLKRTVDLLERNQLTPTPQDETQISYAPKLRKEDGRVNWNRPALYLTRQIRAFNPWPGTFSRISGKLVKFWLANPSQKTSDQAPGTIIEITKRSLYVVCGEQSVAELLELQPENRPKFSAADFIHGYLIEVGDRFE
jgi:methionyl-tRNA formyltransferase